MYLCLLLAVFAVSCASEGALAEQAPTEDAVERAWAEAAECLTNAGFIGVEVDRDDNTWSISFGGDADGTIAGFRYDRCVGDAEKINLALLRTLIPEGAERLAVAVEFQTCLESAGLENPVAYDPENPDSSAVLADAITKLGYSNETPDVADDPRFSEVLSCFDRYERLFPDRFS